MLTTKTRTLFHTLKLPTGDWTIEIAHDEATTHYDFLPVDLVEAQFPVDPWGDYPILTDAVGTPIWEATRLMHTIGSRQ